MSALSLPNSEVLSRTPEEFEPDGLLTQNGNDLRVIQAGYKASHILRQLNFWRPDLIHSDRIRSEGVRMSVVETDPIPMGIADDRDVAVRLTLHTGRYKHIVDPEGNVLTHPSVFSRGVIAVSAELHTQGLPVIEATASTLHQGSDTLPSLRDIRDIPQYAELTDYSRIEFINNNIQSVRDWMNQTGRL